MSTFYYIPDGDGVGGEGLCGVGVSKGSHLVLGCDFSEMFYVGGDACLVTGSKNNLSVLLT